MQGTHVVGDLGVVGGLGGWERARHGSFSLSLCLRSSLACTVDAVGARSLGRPDVETDRVRALLFFLSSVSYQARV